MTVDILNWRTGAVVTTVAGSTLSGISLAGLRLVDADFRGLDVSSTDFRGANCTGARFDSGNCTDANFRRTNLENTVFTGATITGAAWLCSYRRGATIPFPQSPVRVLCFGGQSNRVSTVTGTRPAGSWPRSDIPSWINIPGTYDSAGWVDLDWLPTVNTFGAELALATKIKDTDGNDCAVIKCAQGATSMAAWVPGQTQGNTLIATYAAAVAALEAQFSASREFRFYGFWWLGEDDARLSGGGGIPTWARNFRLMAAGLQQVVGYPMPWSVVRLQSWLSGTTANWANALKAEQLKVASVLTDVDTLANDGLHLTNASEQNKLGSGDSGYSGTMSEYAAYQLMK